MDCIVRGAIEVKLYPTNMNRDVGFCLSKSQKLPQEISIT
jgi:hypothetical protein